MGRETLNTTPPTLVETDTGKSKDDNRLVVLPDNTCNITGVSNNLTAVKPYARPLLPTILLLYHPHSDVKPFR